ncbi:hypothetical protein [Cryptosporangium phraense]|uniref:Uncharacterized protein n=1 Tax=Cryptosporangium phraense TaxID=2593070 RepID=A0A545AG75_9ACTN|nr:hypothetical protein [Cryptosporangium phraense]TQS40333.1 hypothetical protein FL583_35545 [Cryptosporangium phraense]
MNPDDYRTEELRLRLRAAADEHHPDRAAMLERLARRRASAPPSYGRRPFARSAGLGPVRSGPRAAWAAAALVGVVALSMGGTWFAVDLVGRPAPREVAEAPPAPLPPATTPAAETPSAPEPSASARPTSKSPRPSASKRTSKPPSPVETVPSGSNPVRDYLWSDGSIDPNSNDNWAQSNVTLKNRQPVTALDVTIKVAVTNGVKVAGKWTSVPNDKITLSVREQSGWLYYRFTLDDGATLAPGSYVFAGQYSHSGARDANDDAYLATASAGHDDVSVHGTFA